MKNLGTYLFEAARQSAARGIAVTARSSRELRDAIDAGVRARSVFSARAANAVFVSKIKEVVTAVAEGQMDESTARWLLGETLRAVGYTPEGGFPGIEPGKIPPAVRGTIEDLSSKRRLDLIIRTQVDLMRGAAKQFVGMQKTRFEVAPAWELIRIVPVNVERDWKARWAVADGKLYAGRMIALKGDPVWGELGASGNFDDALDVDHPPFAFNSGMGWQEIMQSEAEDLGLSGPSGESLAEWLTGETKPRIMAGEFPFPDPVISVSKVDGDILKALKANADVEETPGEPLKIQMTGTEARAARREARRLESAQIWEEARARRTDVEALIK